MSELFVDDGLRISVTFQRPRVEEAVVHAYSTQSIKPWFVVAKSGAQCLVPTGGPGQLCLQLFCREKTDEGRSAYQRVGHAVLSHVVSGDVGLFDDTGRVEVARVRLTVLSGTRLVVPAAPTHAPAPAKPWWREWQACHPALDSVHVDELQNFEYPRLPGFAFSWWTTAEPESEAFFQRAGLICLARRGWDVDALDDVQRAAIIVAEAGQFVPGCHVYTQDVEFEAGTRAGIDRFSADMRVTLTGDCEDYAHDNALFWYELRRLPPLTSQVVRRMQVAARCYLGLEVLGGVNMRLSGSNAPYAMESVGNADGVGVCAHAFNLLIPCDAALKMADRRLQLDNLAVARPGLRVLVADSTRTNDVDYLCPTYPIANAADPAQAYGRCVRTVQPDHYMFLISSYVLAGLVYPDTQTACPEVFFTQDGKRGALVASLFGGPLPQMRPTVDERCAAETKPWALDILRQLHPIPPYEVDGLPPPVEPVVGRTETLLDEMAGGTGGVMERINACVVQRRIRA